VVATEVEAEAEEEKDKVVETLQKLAHLMFELSATIVGHMAAVLMQEPTVLPKLLVIKARLRLKIRWVDPLRIVRALDKKGQLTLM